MPLREFFSLLRSKIIQHIFWVVFSSMLVMLFGSLATIILARNLGIANFGIYSLFLSIIMLMGSLSDFGIDTSFVRFSSLYLQKDKEKASAILGISLKIKIFVSVLISFIGIIFSKHIANGLFSKPELSSPLTVAFFCLVGIALLGFVQNNLRAMELFKKYSFLNSFHSVVSLVFVCIVWITGNLNLTSAMVIIFIMPFISSLMGLLIGPKDFLNKEAKPAVSLKKLFHFGKWIWLRTICGLIFIRLDIIMLSYFKSMSEVSFYAAAFGLASKLSIINNSLITVLLPRVSRLETPSQIIVFAKRFLKITSFCIVPLFLILFFSNSIIALFYGKEFLPAVFIFKILFIRFLIAIITNPLFLVAYAIDKPQVLAFSSAAVLIFGFIAFSFLIPLFGGVGAAITLLLLAILHPILVFALIRRDLFPGRHQ